MKIALFGYGKMGKEIEQIALQRGHEIALKIDVSNINSITNEDLKKCDTAIEFSTPASALSNMTKCFDAGIPVAVGTTGWYDKLGEVKKICKEKDACLFYASNFSIGVNMFFRMNEQLAKMMNKYSDYNVSMEEIHHVHKLDAPSGTAITLANQIIENVNRKKKYVNTSPPIPSPKGEGSFSPAKIFPEELEIISKRIDEVTGTHSVKYFSSIDDIEIKHTAHNRKGFATGAMLAAEFLKGKKGIFGMNDLMQL
ncbi:MAG: 4-hydroxy-tetrahydrodipicolinate reductase [Bacteroidetes bacterium]|nr:4-hydroxy-tetrahydrodipicolinate reductase [Bacteroidota bacterium]